jgi:hypothetical protein
MYYLDLTSDDSILNLKQNILTYLQKIKETKKCNIIWTYFQSAAISDITNIKYKIAHKCFKNIKKIDLQTYKQYIDKSDGNTAIFRSLNKKTCLIIPKKPSINLTEFAVDSDNKEWLLLWKDVATTTNKLLLIKSPLYISTHGHGVSYLHIRIEAKPLYYEPF